MGRNCSLGLCNSGPSTAAGEPLPHTQPFGCSVAARGISVRLGPPSLGTVREGCMVQVSPETLLKACLVPHKMIEPVGTSQTL